MDIAKKLEFHLEEAAVHIARLRDVLSRLEKLYPITKETLQTTSLEDKDKLDVLAFRFAKLQDLLGVKIFREYLAVLQYPVEDKNFLEISYGSLKESKYLLHFSLVENYLSKANYEQAIKLADDIGAMLWGIIRKL